MIVEICRKDGQRFARFANLNRRDVRATRHRRQIFTDYRYRSATDGVLDKRSAFLFSASQREKYCARFHFARITSHLQDFGVT